MQEPNTQGIKMENPKQTTTAESNKETQGKTTNPMDNQQETKEKILRVMTGALSVLSYPPSRLVQIG
jgi:hypothetical protein